MSNFPRYTKHPKTSLWEKAMWLDDYFGHYEYGVQFADGSIYKPHQVVTEIDAAEAKVLNDNRNLIALRSVSPMRSCP